jgi:hypothetical protein
MKRFKVALFLVILFGIGIFAYKKYLKKEYIVQSSSTVVLEHYPKALDSVAKIKKGLTSKNTEEIGNAFTKLITTKVFPYWYGTKWGFYGTTEKPNEGEIACGYFVTTTLRDMGVSIKRIKLAQCASEEMIKSLVSSSNIQRFSNVDINAFEAKLKTTGNGIFVVGLDNHTGFLLLSDEGNYFIHSSGSFPYKVEKDILSKSPILIKSKYKVVGKLSADKQFLNNWVKN